ncbi:serine hydrolase domain-containing protein [Pontimicrobium aquaticum]|uniref:Beta-lactamase family protein n=1 Tax=Pontimicrobium aquaticum TaxID=2565367 RepID=A0A4U0EVP7_9FLAO|nr:serine hydrolase domain-containing protein [Pontimicrobium aquaticum]TJY35933.1 beta-lactamase family protein [Pontimicrobium aquaticum]
MKKTILLLITVALLCSCGNKSEGNSKKADKAFNEKTYSNKLDELFNVLHKNNKFMGTVSLSHEGNVIYSKTMGYNDIDNQKTSTRATKYRVGSITKMFTATMVFKAVDENKLSINQTIDKYFPAIENASKITVGNLLNHRSGIPSFTKDKTFFDYRTEHKSRGEMLKIITSYKSNFEPDSSNEYSNSNYFLLSQILETIYNLPYVDLLQEKIIKPLGLTNTYSGGKITISNNESYSYSLSDKWTEFPETNLSIALGSGSIVSNPNDLNTFIEALFNEQIVSNETLDIMTTVKDNHGMGIMPFNYKDKKGFGHGGHIDAFHSISIYIPQEKLAIAISSNAIDYNINNLLTDILKCYFNEPFELPNFERVEITASKLEKYVGVYAAEKGSGKFTISQENNILYTQLNELPKEPLIYKGNHKFTNEEIGANFIFDLEKNQLGLEQSGVADIYLFTKQ